LVPISYKLKNVNDFVKQLGPLVIFSLVKIFVKQSWKVIAQCTWLAILGLDHFFVCRVAQNSRDKYYTDAGLLNKSSTLAGALGVTKFINDFGHTLLLL
jgi:hypothetical protein